MNKNLFMLFIAITLATEDAAAEFVPEKYHQSNGGQFNNAIKELYKLNLSGTENILDVGSGDGRTSLFIAQNYIPQGTLVGIDNNAHMIKFATTHTAAPNTFYRYADISEYSDNNAYDVVVSFWTLHWVLEYTKAIENIALSLKYGGKALLCHVIDTDPLEPIVNQLLSCEKWNQYKKETITLLNAPSLSCIAHALEKTGLTIESLEIKKNGEWMPIQEMKQNILSLPFFDFIPSNIRKEFCTEVLQEFIKQYPLNENGEIFNWLPVIIMVLKK